ncbi:MAG TPA: transposase [Pseudomonadales bacterium]|jgi:ribosomal protein S27E|nr:transposase [Pseudomonadales bacterium]HJP50535.1 transposase [Pseudomonadales bacterium]|tara:strand:- start:41 stop:1534 length:1494 start_codon:yes stop_codon:yes gene_type:complete
MLENTSQLSSLQKSPGDSTYKRHKPEETDLYKIIEQNLPIFQSHLSNADISLPAFVHNEFRSYLRCGMLKHGFLRVKCNGCRFEHLVAFSCKLRGFCPSCGARRMVETSAHLIDHVIPVVPVRQWVLSFPWPLRLLFARQPNTLSRCLAIIIRAIETDLINRAGLTRASGAQTGIVTLVQRFGSALNLNIHLHMIALDGVYTVGKSGKAKFHSVKAPNQTELRTLLNRVIQRVVRRLEKEGLLIPDPEQPWLDLDFHEPMDTVSAASIRYRIAIGPHSGSRTLTLQDPLFIRTDKPVKASTANRDGFSLNTAVSCQPYQRDRLERLCRYVTRPAICLERLTVRTDGKIQYELKNPFRNGTTHILFSPLDFLSKLAALVPLPRHNLVRYHGVFAPNSRMRKHIIPKRSRRVKRKEVIKTDKTFEDATSQDELMAPLSWAQRLKRVFNIDITLCPICGGTMRVITDITDPDIIQKILDHLEPQPPPRKRVAAIQSQNRL